MALVVDASDIGVGAIVVGGPKPGQVQEWSDVWSTVRQEVTISGYHPEDQTHREAVACVYYMHKVVTSLHQPAEQTFLLNDNMAWVKSMIRQYSTSTFFMECHAAMQRHGLDPAAAGWGKGGSLSPADKASRAGKTERIHWGMTTKWHEARTYLQSYLEQARQWRRMEDEVPGVDSVLEPHQPETPGLPAGQWTQERPTECGTDVGV